MIEEFGSWNRDVPNLPGTIIAVAETDFSIIERFQTAVGDRNTEDVSPR
jgi:hypothetical protein